MNPSHQPPAQPTLADKDLVEQARPGHGIPSQDTSSAAQQVLTPEETEREAKSVLTGGGVMVGAAAGAAIGVALAGPLGAAVGGTAGAVVGALGGRAASPLVNDDNTDVADTTVVPPHDPGR